MVPPGPAGAPPPTNAAETPVTFVAPSWNAPFGIKLKVAEFPDGGQAVLDGRGLLHLRAADPSLPEITLVLHSRRVAGWAEGDRVWGDSYFTGGTTNISDSEAYHTLLLPIIDSLR